MIHIKSKYRQIMINDVSTIWLNFIKKTAGVEVVVRKKVIWRSTVNKTNLFLDLGILGAFLVAMEPFLTGLPLHEWLSVAFAAVVIIHILLHWQWVVSVGLNFFKKLFHTSRLKFVVDALMFLAVTTVMMSGIMISRSVSAALGIELVSNPAWRFLHSLSANLSMGLVGLHFALNWRWVAAMAKRYIAGPVLSQVRKPQPAPAVQVVMAEINEK